jgi:hypothetical protein
MVIRNAWVDVRSEEIRLHDAPKYKQRTHAVKSVARAALPYNDFIDPSCESLRITQHSQ